MKKTLLGTGLLICGTLGIVGKQICDAIILTPTSETIVHWNGNGLQIFGIILFIIGVLINAWGFFGDNGK